MSSPARGRREHDYKPQPRAASLALSGAIKKSSNFAQP